MASYERHNYSSDRRHYRSEDIDEENETMSAFDSFDAFHATIPRLTAMPASAPVCERLFRPKNLQTGKVYPSSTLTKLVQVITLEGRSKLQRLEFYPNWVVLPTEITLHETELDGMITHLRNTVAEMTPLEMDDYVCYELLRIYGLAPIISNNALAYMMMLRRDFVMADEYLCESNKLIDIGYNYFEVLPEYLKGLFYIAQGLQLLLASHINTGRKDDIKCQSVLMKIEEYDRLSEKAKIAVTASKHCFLQMIHFREPHKAPTISEMVAMDPEFFQWRLEKYAYSRSIRRQKKGNISPPSADEIENIQAAIALAPDNPLSILYLCTSMAEYIRVYPEKDENDCKNSLHFGPWEFASEAIAASFIVETCYFMLKHYPSSVKIELVCNDILENAIPFKYKDPPLARECVFQSYRCGQRTSSRCNMKIAQFMMGLKVPEFRPKLTESMLLASWRLDTRNLDALFYLFLVYMSEPVEFSQKLRMLFAAQMHNYDLPAPFVKKLMFLKGCFYMALGETDNAILTWVGCYETTDRLDFSLLRAYSFVFRVFRWSRLRLNLPFIMKETNKYLCNQSEVGKAKILFDGLSLEAILTYLYRDQQAAQGNDEFFKRIYTPKYDAEVSVQHLLSTTLLSEIGDDSGIPDQSKDEDKSVAEAETEESTRGHGSGSYASASTSTAYEADDEGSSTSKEGSLKALWRDFSAASMDEENFSPLSDSRWVGFKIDDAKATSTPKTTP